MLYLRSLEKVLNEKDIKRAPYVLTKRMCELILNELRTEQQVNQQVFQEDGDETPFMDKTNNNNYMDPESAENSKHSSETSTNDRDQERRIMDSEKYFIPFELACGGDSVQITKVALDGIQKLIAHGELTGDYPNSANPNKRLIDRIVETICSCYHGAETDEGIELQIIKALLTVVTSQHVQIHEGSILLTLRTCFNIFLTTKNSINQTTTRAMLTQMLNSIFTRIEITTSCSDQSNPKSDGSEESIEIISDDTFSSVEINSTILEEITASVKDWDRGSIEWYSNLDLTSFHLQQDFLLFESQKSDEIMNYGDGSIGGSPEFEINQPVGPEGDNKKLTSSNLLSQNNMESAQKDAFLTFWALCKLATKSTNTDEIQSGGEILKSLETKSKILAFQLLKSVVENCGTVFRTHPIFLTAIKQHLSSVMLQVGVSPIQEVYQINLDLLVIMITKFRNVLLENVGELCNEILFPVLESSNNVSSPEYKLLAVGAISGLFKDISSLIELFANNDCRKLTEFGIFEKLVQANCKLLIIEENHVPDSTNSIMISARMLAMESIVGLLQKMSISIKRVDDVECENSEECIVPNDSFPKTGFVAQFFNLIGSIKPSSSATDVDLLIQQFAKDYSGSFHSGILLKSADGIYSLVYNCLRLIAELLAVSQGKCRATKEWFIKINQPIVSEDQVQFQLPENFLSGVYDELEAYVRQKIKHRKRHICVKSHNNSVVTNAMRLVAVLGLQQSYVSNEKQVRYIRRMFKVMGNYVLNALMGTLLNCEDSNVSDYCLGGMHTAIHIACVLNLKMEKDYYMQALSRLTLGALKEIKSKNASAMVIISKTSSTTKTDENGIMKTIITTTTETKSLNVDIIRCLLNVAISEGNCLNNSWLDALKCISQLEAAQLMRKNNMNGSRTSSPNPSQNFEKDESQSWYAWASSLVPNFWDSSGSKLDINSVKESMDAHVNRIFLNSVKLDDHGILEFFKALCQVSLIEITHPETPRSFVYEKIFEVAYMNIHRPILAWLGIWQVLSDYFSHLACSSDEDVSFFAIDSITKLATFLLEKETLSNFRFQSYFMKPYEIIIKNSPYVSTQEYVLKSIGEIIQLNAAVIKSGWIPLLNTLKLSVLYDETKNSESSFDVFKNILEMFEKDDVNLMDALEVLLKCLKELTFCGKSKKVQTESMELLKRTAKIIHSQKQIDLNVNLIWNNGWLPMFQQLSSIIIPTVDYVDKFTDEMQAKALSLIFEFIKIYGDEFTADWWKSLFGILFEIFNQLKIQGDVLLAEESVKSLTKGNYNQYYCYYYVKFAITDTFIRHYDTVGITLLENFLDHLKWSITQNHDQIALSGVQCLHQIIRMLQQKFTTREWTLLNSLVIYLLQNTQPTASHLNSQEEHVDSKDKYMWNPIVQLELVKVMKSIIFEFKDKERSEVIHCSNEATMEHKESSICQWIMRESLDESNILHLLDVLEKRIQIVTLADYKQDQEAQMHQLQDAFVVDMYVKILFEITNGMKSEDKLKKAEDRLIHGLHKVFHHFLETNSTDSRNSLTESIIYSFKGIQAFPIKKFQIVTSSLYPLLCDMLEIELEPLLSLALSKYLSTVIHLKIPTV